MQIMDTVLQDLSNIVNSYTEQKQIHLFVSYYVDSNPTRAAEINACLQLNCQNRLFQKIIIINESTADIAGITPSERIVILHNPSRLRFCDFFAYANTFTQEDTINILINSDIVLGENFNAIALKPKQAFCISRHEFLGQGNYAVLVGGGSHDCWIWRGHMSEAIGVFFMGKFFCDGVLCNQMYEREYELKNPMLDLKIYHVHCTNIRNYSYHDRIHGQRRGIRFSRNDGLFSAEDVYDDGYY